MVKSRWELTNRRKEDEEVKKKGFTLIELLMVIAIIAILAAIVSPVFARARGKTRQTETKVLGQEKIFAFCHAGGYDVKQLRSVTLTFADPAEWRYWRDRGVVPAVGQGWPALLAPPWSLEKAVDVLISRDYGDNPNPVVCIDEFGFDFGEEMDQKVAEILDETKRRRPELGIAVWHMHGPMPKVLADAYRKSADLVMMECYLGNTGEYWWIATQVYVAKMHGLIKKSIFYLALGGEWARTKQEIERQIRFIRLIAPESPGVGFFAPDAPPELIASADELCSRWDQIPTDGSGLPSDVIELQRTFSKRYRKPTLVVSPYLVLGDRELKTMWVYILNLGDKDAKDVKVRLKNPEEAGGDVFAEGVVSLVPKRYEAIATLPMIAEVKGWRDWKMEVEAKGCEILDFTFARGWRNQG